MYIDADACPVLNEAINIASRRKFEVVLVGNETQNLQRFAGCAHITIIEVPTGLDSADFALAKKVSPLDIVVTDDIGLASIVLSRGARVVNTRGREYNEATIYFELHMRHVGKKIRRSGGRTRGPSVYTRDNRKAFITTLKRILQQINEKNVHKQNRMK